MENKLKTLIKEKNQNLSMTKTYTWKEIKDVLYDKLKDTKHILTYGTIGSNNIEHDIDTIITKKPKSKHSDFYKEVHSVFDYVNKYVNEKHNAKLIRTSRFDSEIEVQILADSKQNDLVFQVMVYSSLSNLKKHWISYMEKDNIDILLKKNYQPIIGKVKNLFKDDFNKEIPREGVLMYMNDLDRINANYPEKTLLKVMNSLYDYSLRKLLGKETRIATNEKEVREIFYHLCDEVDK